MKVSFTFVVISAAIFMAILYITSENIKTINRKILDQQDQIQQLIGEKK